MDGGGRMAASQQPVGWVAGDSSVTIGFDNEKGFLKTTYLYEVRRNPPPRPRTWSADSPAPTTACSASHVGVASYLMSAGN
ncbi:hypothetical protein RB195_017223 [Necator americanus]|uniref:DOMON domain-containing protein n=1 Tax=Necator americanus TaxID=51031 RepID=A0ABR1C7W2_NECAM